MAFCPSNGNRVENMYFIFFFLFFSFFPLLFVLLFFTPIMEVVFCAGSNVNRCFNDLNMHSCFKTANCLIIAVLCWCKYEGSSYHRKQHHNVIEHKGCYIYCIYLLTFSTLILAFALVSMNLMPYSRASCIKWEGGNWLISDSVLLW